MTPMATKVSPHGDHALCRGQGSMSTNATGLRAMVLFAIAAWIWAIPCEAQTSPSPINPACILHYTADNIPQICVLNNGRSLDATLVVNRGTPLSVAGGFDCTTAMTPGSHTILVNSSDGRQDQSSFTLQAGYNEICSLMDNGLECHTGPLVTGRATTSAIEQRIVAELKASAA